MMMPPPACVVSAEKNTRPGVGAIRSEQRILGIRKGKDKLRLDCWIEIRSTG